MRLIAMAFSVSTVQRIPTRSEPCLGRPPPGV